MATALEPKQVENMLKYCAGKLSEIERLVGKKHPLYEEVNGEYNTIREMIGPGATYGPADRQWGIFTERLIGLFSGADRIETKMGRVKAEMDKAEQDRKKLLEEAAKKKLAEEAKKKAADDAEKKAEAASADWLKEFPWEQGPALVVLRDVLKKQSYKLAGAINYVKKSYDEAVKDPGDRIDGLEVKQWKRMLDGLVKVKPLVEKNRKDGGEPTFDRKPLFAS